MSLSLFVVSTILALGPRFHPGWGGRGIHAGGFAVLGKIMFVGIACTLGLSIAVMGWLYVSDYLKERYGIVGLSRSAGWVVLAVILVALGIGLGRLL